jgi:hypothetical protein
VKLSGRPSARRFDGLLRRRWLNDKADLDLILVASVLAAEVLKRYSMEVYRKKTWARESANSHAHQELKSYVNGGTG